MFADLVFLAGGLGAFGAAALLVLAVEQFK